MEVGLGVVAENRRPSPGASDPGPLEREDDGPLTATAGSTAPPGASLLRWSQHHAHAARSARTAAHSNGFAARPTLAALPGPTTAGTPPDPSQPARSAAVDVRPETRTAPSTQGDIRRRALGRLAGSAVLLGWLVALLMVVHAAFVVLRANPANPWTTTIGSWAPALDLGLGELATSAGPTVALLVGHGAAAVAWVAIGTATGWLIRRIGAR